VSEHTPSEFVRHVACPACGSSDANALYTDGHTFCHSCHAHARGEGEVSHTPTTRRNPNLIPHDEIIYSHLTARKISEETCRYFDYGIATFNGQKVQVANYRTPDGTAVVAQKVRFANKDFVMLGDAKAAGLFAQHLWRDGGKYVVVTEGEVDTLSVGEVEMRKWPVVSVPSGAQGAKKALQKQLDWLEKFENVILMFDMDDPGRKAAAECADLFTPGKCKIASLPLKDANDMLKAGRGAEIVQAKFSAKSHRPDGIVAGTELWETRAIRQS
jgi:twinkle protein